MTRQHVVIQGYKVERNALRVDGALAEPWFVWMVAIGMLLAAVPTAGITLILLPIAIGFLSKPADARNHLLGRLPQLHRDRVDCGLGKAVGNH